MAYMDKLSEKKREVVYKDRPDNFFSSTLNVSFVCGTLVLAFNAPAAVIQSRAAELHA